jgi:integrase
VPDTPTLKEFALRFLDGYAKANRLKPSGIARRKRFFTFTSFLHWATKTPDAITTEDAQRVKSVLSERSPKTVNNVLTTLSVILRTAVEWDLIERVPCSIKLLRTPKNEASFYDFEQYERLVDAASADSLAHLVVLLGGEAGLRCGEIMALEWTDVDLHKRKLCVARSERKGPWRCRRAVGRMKHGSTLKLPQLIGSVVWLWTIREGPGASPPSRP